jgi:hypothetical protein
MCFSRKQYMYCAVRCFFMVTAVDIIMYIFLIATASSFAVKYGSTTDRCNPEFAGQLHCLSGIILSHKPFFSFMMHSVGGMVLLSVGLKVETDREVSLTLLTLMYISLSSVVNFDVHNFKPIHFISLFCVLVFSVAFVWLQCIHIVRIVYIALSAAFVALIVFNFLVTHWKWPWMNLQALLEIAWVICLLISLLGFQSTSTVSLTAD